MSYCHLHLVSYDYIRAVINCTLELAHMYTLAPIVITCKRVFTIDYLYTKLRIFVASLHMSGYATCTLIQYIHILTYVFTKHSTA